MGDFEDCKYFDCQECDREGNECLLCFCKNCSGLTCSNNDVAELEDNYKPIEGATNDV